MIRGEWVISFAKSHSRECALPMKATPKAVSITANTKMNFAHDSHGYCQQKGGCYVK